MIDQDTTQQEQAETSINTSWLDALPEGLKKEQSLSKFKDTASLAQSYLEAEKALNKRVAMPKPESPEEEWQKFYQKLGLPEDKRYTEQRVPEDEEYLKAYEELFYQSGLSKKQGEKLLKGMYEFSSNLQKRQQEELNKQRNSNIDWLKQHYGDAFDSRMPLMQASLQKFGSKELASLIEEANYSPALVDLLVKVGETLKSDSLVTGNEQAVTTDAEGALKEINRLEADSDFMVKLSNKNHSEHDEAVQKMEELYKLAYN